MLFIRFGNPTYVCNSTVGVQCTAVITITTPIVSNRRALRIIKTTHPYVNIYIIKPNKKIKKFFFLFDLESKSLRDVWKCRACVGLPERLTIVSHLSEDAVFHSLYFSFWRCCKKIRTLLLNSGRVSAYLCPPVGQSVCAECLGRATHWTWPGRRSEPGPGARTRRTRRDTGRAQCVTP